MEGCLFCRIVRGEIPSVKVLETDQVLAFADINPLADGHTLVIPKRHAENLWEIDPEDLAAVHRAGIRIATAMRSALRAEGVACLQLNGRAVNQLIMHYHLHLIPRLPGSAEIALTQWELVPGNMERIQDIGRTLNRALPE